MLSFASVCAMNGYSSLLYSLRSDCSCLDNSYVGLYLHRREKENKKRFPTDLNCWLFVVYVLFVVARKRKEEKIAAHFWESSIITW
jgi:hypothetical protein